MKWSWPAATVAFAFVLTFYLALSPGRSKGQNPAQNPPGTPCGIQCGEERWPVKTLTDQDASEVNFTPVEEAVGELASLPTPKGNDEAHRLNSAEETTFAVRGRLVGFKQESDGDFHIVIADRQNPSITMVVEIPDPKCNAVCASPKLQQIQTARQKFAASFPKLPAASEFEIVQGDVEVNVTGVGFFDFAHDQVGLARNCFELHPVLDIAFEQPGPFETKKDPASEPPKHPEDWYSCIPRPSEHPKAKAVHKGSHN